MDGEPVWLCSVSYYKHGLIVSTDNWSPKMFKRAARIAREQMAGVGSSKERAFRMNITFCVHRSLSPKEKRSLPDAWKGAPGGLAGGPVEVLWSRGIEHSMAAMPCEAPSRIVIEPSRPDL